MIHAGALCAVLAACGDNLVGLDDSSLPEACIARFTGNFVDRSSLPVNCAVVVRSREIEGGLALDFDLRSTVLGASVGISIDVGTSPTPGAFSSSAALPWSALALRTVGMGGCVYHAGSTAVPGGNYTMTLDVIDDAAAHGDLLLVQYVLATIGTDCGAGDTETIEVAF